MQPVCQVAWQERHLRRHAVVRMKSPGDRPRCEFVQGLAKVGSGDCLQRQLGRPGRKCPFRTQFPIQTSVSFTDMDIGVQSQPQTRRPDHGVNDRLGTQVVAQQLGDDARESVCRRQLYGMNLGARGIPRDGIGELPETQGAQFSLITCIAGDARGSGRVLPRQIWRFEPPHPREPVMNVSHGPIETGDNVQKALVGNRMGAGMSIPVDDALGIAGGDRPENFRVEFLLERDGFVAHVTGFLGLLFGNSGCGRGRLVECCRYLGRRPVRGECRTVVSGRAQTMHAAGGRIERNSLG